MKTLAKAIALVRAPFLIASVVELNRVFTFRDRSDPLHEWSLLGQQRTKVCVGLRRFSR
jgi:hypothetical protein